MKKFRSALAVFLCLALAVPFALCASAAEADGSYEITNPYADINWDAVTAYKTALHSHTNASDGDDNLRASVERHVEAGFDIVATTDHGTVN